MTKTLYIIPTPIGNYEDITLRALRILKEVEFIICEEFKEARRLLSFYKIDKPLVSLNEHNEEENSKEILSMILKVGNAALISDCGTPLFSDPGHHLINICISNEIEIKVLPGANSLTTAISGSNLNIDKFFYAGWLSPKKDIRKKQLLKLKQIPEVIVLMDTPYRLKNVLEDIKNVMGKNLFCVLAFQLTMEDEKFYRGYAYELLQHVMLKNLKGEFVLLLDNRTKI
jgi:16S rRNA (cytidine1402-2'-O)-methyltransferase